MQHPEEALRQALLAMKEEDLSVRAERIAEGTLAKEGPHEGSPRLHF